MTEKNSKHLIAMNVDSFKFYVKEYKILRSVKTSEITTFVKQREIGYLGYGPIKIRATAIVDKERLNLLNKALNDFIVTDSHSVSIEGISFGDYRMTDYEICGSEDDYIYEVKLNLCSLV